MKFLAILKDSLRETLDVKLFYVLGGLSVLVVLFVASITYKPETMDTQVKSVLVMIPMSIEMTQDMQRKKETQGLIIQPDAKNFEQLQKDKEVWDADYRFTLVFNFLVNHPEEGDPFGRRRGRNPAPHAETDEDREVYAEGKKRLTADYVQQKLKDHLGFVPELEVVPEPSKDNEAVFQVTTHGTIYKSRKEWRHKPAAVFGALPIPLPIPMTLGEIIQFIGDWIVGAAGTAIIMFLSVIMTASFLPTMLNKGTVDLLLVKPIHRSTLFLYKFLGGLLFMFLNTVLLMGGIWLALGFQTGIWTNSLLLCIFVYTFQFAIFYALSALAAIFTRSAIVSILGAVMLWVVLFAVGWTHWIYIESERDAATEQTKQHWAFVGYDAVHTILPHYKDIDWLTTRMIKQELIDKITVDPKVREKQIEALNKEYGAYHWSSSLTASGLFIVLVVGLACFRFATKDY